MWWDYCDWDDEGDPRGNTRHVAHHGVTPAEWEQALDAIARGDLEPSASRSGYLTAVGETAGGRTLRIVFELDESPDFVMVRPITGYEPT